VGGVTLSNVRRGVAQTATLGYWAGAPYARRGHTLRAVRTVCAFAFGKLKLHRMEAACLPSNEASRNLLLKAGFSLEGKARAYLKINGAWRDHLLFGLIQDEAGWGEEITSGG
jgi:ribosomal-protein-alanine N-acetyltransferase